MSTDVVMVTSPQQIILPMPTPGSRGAPHFEGKNVEGFCRALETHADAAHIPHNNLPGLVLQYCSRKVQYFIEECIEWDQLDWRKARAELINYYGSNNQAPRMSVDKFRVWTGRHAKQGKFCKLKDVHRYHREFVSISSQLLMAENPRLTDAEVKVLFYRGIPDHMRRKIKRKIPEKNSDCSDPPSVKTLLRLLCKEFDDDDLEDNSKDNVDSDTDSASSDSSDSNVSGDGEPAPKPKKKKSVKFDLPTEPIPIPVEHPTPTMIGALAKQIQDLRISQANIERRLAAWQSGGAPSSSKRKCFICDTSNHRLGVMNCPEVRVLISEGLVQFNTVGRLTRSDGSDLPRALMSGGVAKVLRDEFSALKGKGQETRDPLLHMASVTGSLPGQYQTRLHPAADFHSQTRHQQRGRLAWGK